MTNAARFTGREPCSRWPSWSTRTRSEALSNFSSKEELFLALFDAHSDAILTRLRERIDSLGQDGLTLDDLAELVSRIDPSERDWYLVTTEFTLHAIRAPQAAWLLARHDARLRAELTGAVTAFLAAAGRELTVDAEQVSRLLIALREGGLAQSYVEPDRLPPGRLERDFVGPLLTALSRPTTG
ncbi:TetR family transcriptional regulator C-terminal domain-containing protein [Kitasatospora sp. NPDC051914]|uniref:TetR family transcriptional regulator C-terminal domain-containing protein n=1 Tax=Kitasatospora sp. NPDC051914 TaxID=3154945 RepID=UPI003439B294